MNTQNKKIQFNQDQKSIFKYSRQTSKRQTKIQASVQQIDKIEQKQEVKELILRVAKGLPVDRTPVWLMRQAGRYQQKYQDLCKKYTTFRERSENADIATEVSLQPYHSFKPDGVILFSDILTPLTGMNIPFDIVKGTGPIIHDPIQSMEQVKNITKLVPEESCSFVGQTLRQLKQEIDASTTLLGFVGAPFTLATYSVEGGGSKQFAKIKKMMFSQPLILHAFLDILTENILTYCRYQADNGAQVIQLFDTWGAELSPVDFGTYSLPYIQRIVNGFKQTHPDVPLIFYANGSAGILERVAQSGVDIISVDQYSQLGDAIDRTNNKFTYQGNVDPGVLFGTKDFITQRIKDTLAEASERGAKHILNTGHGIMVGTPEYNVQHFFEVAKSL